MNSKFYSTAKDINGCIDILRELNCFPKWTTRIQDGYTEIAHIGFTCQIATIMFWFVLHEQLCKTGFTEYPLVKLDNLPKLAIFHAFEAYGKHDIPEKTYHDFFENHNTLEADLTLYLNNKIKALTSPELFDYITTINNELEIKIYEASKALSGYYEILEIRRIIRERDFFEFHAHQFEKLKKYPNFPIIREILKENTDTTESEYKNLKNLFDNFSALRHCTRWERRNPIRRYSVLGHSFDVAVYNYLLSLNSYPDFPAQATSNFIISLYHDIAEIWTGDIPMPLKVAIPGLRPRIVEVEIKILEEKVFSLLPEWLISDFKEVMIELISPKQQSQCKIGDSLAAYIEAATQLADNSGDYYYKEVIINAVICTEKISPIMKEVMKKIRKDARISVIFVWYYKAKNFFANLKKTK